MRRHEFMVQPIRLRSGWDILRCQISSQVPDKFDKTLREIEDTQAALRESIGQAIDLAEKSERLLKKHRREQSKNN